MGQDANYKILYEFLEAEKLDQPLMKYGIELDAKTLAHRARRAPGTPLPEWTRLENNQCDGCPLNKEEHPYCPVAVNLTGLLKRFEGEASHRKVWVRVTTPERLYLKETSMQDGLFSIFGIIMATSGCPVMDFLRPMARFHLPFATTEETIVRSTSMYLLSQYFAHKKGQKADIDLARLEGLYAGVDRVNMGILARIHQLIAETEAKGDADQNAMVILTTFSTLLTLEISGKLSGLEYLFTTED